MSSPLKVLKVFIDRMNGLVTLYKSVVDHSDSYRNPQLTTIEDVVYRADVEFNKFAELYAKKKELIDDFKAVATILLKRFPFSFLNTKLYAECGKFVAKWDPAKPGFE